MDWAGTHPYVKKGDDFQHTCGCCGCVFRVVVVTQDGHNEREKYNCPECNCVFYKRASNIPTVTLISKRTDGKTDRHK